MCGLLRYHGADFFGCFLVSAVAERIVGQSLGDKSALNIGIDLGSLESRIYSDRIGSLLSLKPAIVRSKPDNQLFFCLAEQG